MTQDSWLRECSRHRDWDCIAFSRSILHSGHKRGSSFLDVPAACDEDVPEGSHHVPAGPVMCHWPVGHHKITALVIDNDNDNDNDRVFNFHHSKKKTRRLYPNFSTSQKDSVTWMPCILHECHASQCVATFSLASRQKERSSNTDSRQISTKQHQIAPNIDPSVGNPACCSAAVNPACCSAAVNPACCSAAVNPACCSAAVNPACCSAAVRCLHWTQFFKKKSWFFFKVEHDFPLHAGKRLSFARSRLIYTIFLVWSRSDGLPICDDFCSLSYDYTFIHTYNDYPPSKHVTTWPRDIIIFFQKKTSRPFGFLINYASLFSSKTSLPPCKNLLVTVTWFFFQLQCHSLKHNKTCLHFFSIITSDDFLIHSGAIMTHMCMYAYTYMHAHIHTYKEGSLRLHMHTYTYTLNSKKRPTKFLQKLKKNTKYIFLSGFQHWSKPLRNRSTDMCFVARTNTKWPYAWPWFDHYHRDLTTMTLTFDNYGHV